MAFRTALSITRPRALPILSARSAVAVPAVRALSTTRPAAVQGDRGAFLLTVMGESPYPERANKNPMDDYALILGQMHDYGSWIVSGAFSANQRSRNMSSSSACTRMSSRSTWLPRRSCL